MQRRKFILFFGSLLTLLAICAMETPARVQAGSTGGTIGNQDKSVSGGNTPEASRPSSRNQKPHRSVAKSSSCGRAVGTWHWANGATVVIKPNGSVSQSNFSGTWTCKEGQYVFVWSTGYTDRVSLSTDGNQMDAVNNLGIHFSNSFLEHVDPLPNFKLSHCASRLS
jgi:hypothetical protein